MNVIDNAIKYTKKGGVEVSVREKDKNTLLIKITDTGLGMDKKQTTQIFEKFNRGTAGKTSWDSGSGLGLSIAKKFTELHYGKIWAESEGKGKGATFYIELLTNLAIIENNQLL